jgi:sulfur relay (sulfurtransferase) complex TusBCD TusD component (DsrE family)
MARFYGRYAGARQDFPGRLQGGICDETAPGFHPWEERAGDFFAVLAGEAFLPYFPRKPSKEDVMRALLILFAALALTVSALALPARAGGADPLFINLTSDEGHRSFMALSFGLAQMQRGHALAVYLNDRGVLVASRKNSAKFAEQQKTLSQIVAKGGRVLVCPVCSKKYGVGEKELVPGAKISNPDLTGEALFQDGGKTLSW